MREIDRTTRFRRDYKRESKGRHRSDLEAGLKVIIIRLMSDEPLAERYRDLPLTGKWAGFRDCHVKPDLVLIYEKPDDATLRLVRLGSHSELGW